MHQIAPFSKNSRGNMPRTPHSTSVIPHPYRATCTLSLVNSSIFIKTLKNADQIVKDFVHAFTFYIQV